MALTLIDTVRLATSPTCFFVKYTGGIVANLTIYCNITAWIYVIVSVEEAVIATAMPMLII